MTNEVHPIGPDGAPKMTRRAGFLFFLLLPFSSVALAKRVRRNIDERAALDDGVVTLRSAPQDTQERAASNQQPESATAVSVLDFMTPAQITDARQRLGTVDCTAAINAAFAYAETTGRTVYLPDGVYLVGNLLFGSQSKIGQSSAPMGLQGESKTGTILKAKPGMTGTLLKSWSLAGATFRDFAIDTSDSSMQAWDARWMSGAGPSTQNVIEHILVSVHSNFTDATPHVNWDNLNDTYPTGVTVRGSDRTGRNCFISMVQSGGLAAIRNCIWAGGYLRWGAQNGKIDNCWGHGIEFAAGCLNHVEISSGQFYGNIARGNVLWSESVASYQSIRALVFTATQFIADGKATSAYFDLCVYSLLKFTGCQWNGPAIALLGKKSRNDSYASVLVKIEGGTHTGHLVLNDKPGFEIECEGLMNDATGKMVTKNRGGTFTPVVGGGNSDNGTYVAKGDTYGRYLRRGNSVQFKLRVQWSKQSVASPKSHLHITGLPLEFDADGVDSVVLEQSGSTFAEAHVHPILSAGGIGFYLTDGSRVALPAAGDLLLSGTYSVKA